MALKCPGPSNQAWALGCDLFWVTRAVTFQKLLSALHRHTCIQPMCISKKTTLPEAAVIHKGTREPESGGTEKGLEQIVSQRTKYSTSIWCREAWGFVIKHLPEEALKEHLFKSLSKANMPGGVKIVFLLFSTNIPRRKGGNLLPVNIRIKLLNLGQFAKLSAIFFSLLSSKYYYNLEESLELIPIINISVAMYLVAPESMDSAFLALQESAVPSCEDGSETVLSILLRL
ncbi:hypothetical protein EK904_007495 [Melospiza melodia maxima]|nr:hypothetical protein EK904_007495 [Melospiza melodia maxima]